MLSLRLVRLIASVSFDYPAQHHSQLIVSYLGSIDSAMVVLTPRFTLLASLSAIAAFALLPSADGRAIQVRSFPNRSANEAAGSY